MEERRVLTVNKRGMRLVELKGLNTHILLGRALLISKTTGTKAADLKREQLQLVNT
jgi:hypothetical protein